MSRRRVFFHRHAPLLLTLSVLIVLGTPTRIPWGDGPFLLAVAWRLTETLQTDGVLVFFAGWWQQVTPHPPLGYLPVIQGDLLTGSPVWGGRVGAGLGLWLMLLGLKRHLTLDGVKPGWNSTAILLALTASPMVWLAVDQVGWDLFAAALVCHCLAALRESDDLRDLGASARFGGWMAAGFLTKYSFPFFLVLPCIWTGVRLLRQRQGGRGLAVALVVFTVLALPWLLGAAATLRAYLGAMAEDPTLISANVRASRVSAEALSYYPLALKDAWGWPGLLVGAFGLLQVALHAERPHRKGLILASVLGALVGLTTLSVAVDRYVLPLLPLLLLPLGRARDSSWTLVFFGVNTLLWAGSALSFGQGAPATHQPGYAHSVSTLSWPRSRVFLPSDVDVLAWDIDAQLRAAATPDPGPLVGLLLPFDFHLPDVGVYLLQSEINGYSFDLLPIRPPPDGPVPPETRLPDGLTTMIVVDERSRSVAARTDWLNERGFVAETAMELPGGRQAAIFRRAP